jgi:hypothetical protein
MIMGTRKMNTIRNAIAALSTTLLLLLSGTESKAQSYFDDCTFWSYLGGLSVGSGCQVGGTFTPAGYNAAAQAAIDICVGDSMSFPYPYYNVETGYGDSVYSTGGHYWSSQRNFVLGVPGFPGAISWYTGSSVGRSPVASFIACAVVAGGSAATTLDAPTSFASTLNSDNTVSLSWTNPTTYSDGSALTIDHVDIISFDSFSELHTWTTITNGSESYTTSAAATPGANVFDVEVYDSSGNASGNVLMVQASPAWTSYTPTVTAAPGTSFTTVSATGAYQTIGKNVFFTATVTITTNGSAAGYVYVSLPSGITASGTAVLSGREEFYTGKLLQGYITNGATAVVILNYDNTYPGGTGYVLTVSGTFQSE